MVSQGRDKPRLADRLEKDKRPNNQSLKASQWPHYLFVSVKKSEKTYRNNPLHRFEQMVTSLMFLLYKLIINFTLLSIATR